MAEQTNSDLLGLLIRQYVDVKKAIEGATAVKDEILEELKSRGVYTPQTNTVRDNIRVEYEVEDDVVVYDTEYVTIEAPTLRQLLEKIVETISDWPEEPQSVNISLLWEEGYVYGYKAVLV